MLVNIRLLALVNSTCNNLWLYYPHIKPMMAKCELAMPTLSPAPDMDAASPLASQDGEHVAPQAATRRVPRPRPRLAAWSIDILVVDDDAADASLVIDALRRNSSVRDCMSLSAPDVALEHLAHGRIRPGLVLLDIHMPKVSGFKFLSAFRNIPAMRTTPVVFLTTSRHARDVEQARASDICSYIVKPDSFEALRARLDVVVKQCVSGAWNP
jgi:two-component system, response regulator